MTVKKSTMEVSEMYGYGAETEGEIAGLREHDARGRGYQEAAGEYGKKICGLNKEVRELKKRLGWLSSISSALFEKISSAPDGLDRAIKALQKEFEGGEK